MELSGPRTATSGSADGKRRVSCCSSVLFLLKWYEANARLGPAHRPEDPRRQLQRLARVHAQSLALAAHRSLVALGRRVSRRSPGGRLDLGMRLGNDRRSRWARLSVVTIALPDHPPSDRAGRRAPAPRAVSATPMGSRSASGSRSLAALAIICGGYLAMRDEAAKVAAGAEASEPERDVSPTLRAPAASSAQRFQWPGREDAPASLAEPAGPDAPSVATPAQPSSKPPGQAPAGSQEG